MTQPLTKENLNEAINELNKNAGAPIDHYVINLVLSLQETYNGIVAKFPIKIDIRTVYHPTGNPLNWSVEAIGIGKSLGVFGCSPTT